jgi:outer membrane protein assembly factor BamE (lipoprotein component of BamABCDE complex)
MLAAVLVSLLMGATGCNSLTIENVRKLQIDHTTDAEIKTLFGDPKTSETFDTDGAKVAVRYFQYQLATDVGPVAWLNYYILHIETKDGVAKGYLYVSDEGKNATVFDPSKADQIQYGVTTRQQAIDLLGPPAGMAFKASKLDAIKKIDPASNVASYLMWVNAPPASGIVGFLKVQISVLIVQLDANDKVISKTSITDEQGF